VDPAPHRLQAAPRHLIEQPTLATCLAGPLPVRETSTIA
jgi:hypothetical protein